MQSKHAARSAQTRDVIERVAGELFETRGFANVSAEEIVAAAGVTRGALYHHYGGKEGLFEAVAEARMQRLHERILRGGATPDSREAVTLLKGGIRRFLRLSTTPRTQQVLFVDAPVVMGWHRWRQLDARYGLGMLRQALEAAAAQGALRVPDPGMAAQLLLSAMIEASMFIAAASNRTKARGEAERLLDGLVDGLR